MQLKLLFITTKLDQFGGIQKYNQTLISTLKKFGCDVYVVERQPNGIFAKIFFSFHIFLFVIRHRPDFIICAHLNFSPLCYFFKKIFNINYSISVYGIEVARIQKNIFKKTLTNATHIIYLFENTANGVVTQIPNSKQKLFNIPNSIDGDMFVVRQKSKSLISSLGLQNAKVLLTIGRMSVLDGDNKGYRRVVEAMKEVIKKVPNVKYLLVGGGDDVTGVKELIHKLDLMDTIVVVDAPPNDELVDYYNLGDIFVMPSKNEGFPQIVVLEALSCGVPVVVGNQNGADKLIANRFGAVVPSDDVHLISEAIIAILQQKAPIQIFDRYQMHENIINIFGYAKYKARVGEFVQLISKQRSK